MYGKFSLLCHNDEYQLLPAAGFLLHLVYLALMPKEGHHSPAEQYNMCISWALGTEQCKTYIINLMNCSTLNCNDVLHYFKMSMFRCIMKGRFSRLNGSTKQSKGFISCNYYFAAIIMCTKSFFFCLLKTATVTIAFMQL